jgi:hypothetical protein
MCDVPMYNWNWSSLFCPNLDRDIPARVGDKIRHISAEITTLEKALGGLAGNRVN